MAPSDDATPASARRRRILNRLSVIRLVLQIMARSPAHLPFRWGVLLALEALDELARELLGPDRPA